MFFVVEPTVDRIQGYQVTVGRIELQRPGMASGSSRDLHESSRLPVVSVKLQSVCCEDCAPTNDE